MIKRAATALVWILMSAGASAANNAPASDASIRQMLELTDARQLIDGLKGQISAVMNTAMQNAMKGQTLTPERQAIIDRMTVKMSAVAAEMLNWDALLPIYMRTYRDSFTQDEIDAGLHATCAGKNAGHSERVHARAQGATGQRRKKIAGISSLRPAASPAPRQ